MNETVIEADGVAYTLQAEAVRTSLGDGPPMLWGFPVRVLREGALVSTKTCFVGRVSVAARDPGAPDAPSDRLIPVLYALAFERVRARIEKGEFGDEIVFA